MATLTKEPELPGAFPKTAAREDQIAMAADGAPPGATSDAVNDAHARPSPTLHMFDDYLRGLRLEERRERDRLRHRLERKRLKAATLREKSGWRDAHDGEEAYLDLLADIILNGAVRDDRTGVGCLSVFGRQMRFDLAKGFPLLTTKKLHLRSILIELLWFLRGDTNVAWLQENGVTIWNEWADETGDLGPVYGKQWRSWATPDGRVIDQIANVVRQIKDNPESRRLVVSAWNPADVDDMALPPCHCLFQFAVLDGTLNLQLYQRSADVFLGVPFNIASYAALLLMVAQATGLKPGEFVHAFGDAHLYLNHLDQAVEQMGRAPRPFPVLRLNPLVTDLFDFRYADFTLEDYDPHPHIKGKVAV